MHSEDKKDLKNQKSRINKSYSAISWSFPKYDCLFNYTIFQKSISSNSLWWIPVSKYEFDKICQFILNYP
jgi:hypothetical protein